MENLSKFEADLWEAADQLRANSKLTSSEYCMPVLGVIFLRHATNRYDDALRQIEADQAAGKMPKRALVKGDFLARRALMLPKPARYDELLKLPQGSNLGNALVEAMNSIEKEFDPLKDQLPKDYEKFGNDLLESLLRIFDSEVLRTATGDVFGRIYEYFLMEFAMQGAQDNGEFFTPPSLVQTIVNVIEPDHGVVFDPACGSGGMFVQSSHFIEREGKDTMKRVTFYGQEKTATTIRLAKMNLAVHGLQGDIREANTFYEDVHRLPEGKPLWGNCDFVMANPPFNVDMVDAKVKDDRRLPFGLPGVNKAKKVSNGNYLWISYFHSYLGPKGRAGFVMSSQASSAGNDEAEVRRKIVETGDVDVMISIRPNFFYTRTVPCELWFFDKSKPTPSPPAPLPAGEERTRSNPTHYRGGFDFSGLVERARELRKKQTTSEDLLWELIRNRQLAGMKFRRQHQIGDYLVDFYCHECRLVVEVDGDIHDDPAKAKKDATRQKYLESLGNTVIRFRNEEVLNNPSKVLTRIVSAAKSDVAALPSPPGRRAGDEGDVALNKKGNVLMLDARNVFRKVTRKIYDFSPEQLANLTAIVWLYRGENERFTELINKYREECRTRRRTLSAELPQISGPACEFAGALKAQLNLRAIDQVDAWAPRLNELSQAIATFSDETEAVVKNIAQRDFTKNGKALSELAESSRTLHTHLRQLRKVADALLDTALESAEKKEKQALEKTHENLCAQWDALDQCLTENIYWTRQVEWLKHRFPKGEYCDVPGLCKVVTTEQIKAADWSLTPGRYVGVAPAEVDENFDFEQVLRDIHVELADLNKEASALAKKIQKNFEGLGI